MEIFSERNVIQKPWSAKFFSVPPNSAPGLRHRVSDNLNITTEQNQSQYAHTQTLTHSHTHPQTITHSHKHGNTHSLAPTNAQKLASQLSCKSSNRFGLKRLAQFNMQNLLTKPRCNKACHVLIRNIKKHETFNTSMTDLPTL